jgi:hypothetical protein
LIAAAKSLDLIRRVMPAVQVHVEQHVNVDVPPVPADPLHRREGSLASRTLSVRERA